MGLLDGKVAIVTGAGRGIGRGEALELAREGARVVVNELDADAGAAVVLEVEELGGEALLDTSDVADVDAARSMLQRAVDRWGALDALVNNAGVLRDRTIVNMTPEEWDTVIRVHLRGHYAPTHLACAYWKAEQRPGRIVCTSSTSGLLGNFGQTNYGTAKAGIAAFAQIVAMEMARYGVTCNAIAPAARTRMTESAYGSIGTDADDFDFWHPDNVAPLVAYLCSDAAAHISGKVFGIQGDAVELYQPWTSVAVIENDDERWTPEDLSDRINDLFDESSIEPGPENGMARLRYSITTRATL
ncbi:MAG TPA: SDR family NAD(P)-dependent oxidoreductase [Acidothermales bacterium]|jgi:NAD(P)-dependent dehydrogenase (short-subunit alcohol dehydrogenase family)|nr:SDR family NAD(P)-dependent oxidoreductase [Actinomycetes bacterium]